MPAPTDITALPLVLFDADVCELLDISLTTLKKLRRAGAFPITELPALDKRHRYGRADVQAYLNRDTATVFARRRAS
jgi:predicted site-specific integrase-resolvase